MKEPLSLRTAHAVEYTITAGDGAQNNLALQPLVAANQRKKVLDIYATASANNSVSVAFRVGFADTALPAAALGAGVEGMLLSHGGVLAGSGFFGVSGLGQPGEDLFATVSIPSGGDARIIVLYELITV